MNKIYEMHKERTELEEYARLEGTEIGEMCRALLQMADCATYVTDKFADALAKEILEQLEMFQTQTSIVEKEETYTTTVKRLEWINE